MAVPFTWGGKEYSLCFTWAVFSALEAKWGEEWQTQLGATLTGSPAHLTYVAGLVSGGELDGSQPVPVVPFLNALYRAYELAWSGHDVGEATEASEADGKKPGLSVKSWMSTLMRGSQSDTAGKTSLA